MAFLDDNYLITSAAGKRIYDVAVSYDWYFHCLFYFFYYF